MTTYNPSFPACKLYKKTSAKGNVYFVGRWGGARVTLLLSNETAEDGGEVWNLMLSEAPAKRPDSAGRSREHDGERPSEPGSPPAANGKASTSSGSVAARDWQRPARDLDRPPRTARCG